VGTVRSRIEVEAVDIFGGFSLSASAGEAEEIDSSTGRPARIERVMPLGCRKAPRQRIVLA